MNKLLQYALLAFLAFTLAACSSPVKEKATPDYVASTAEIAGALVQLDAALDVVAYALDGRVKAFCPKSRQQLHTLLQAMQNLRNFVGTAKSPDGQYSLSVNGLVELHALGKAAYIQALKAVSPHWNALPYQSQTQLLAFGRQAEALDTYVQTLLSAPGQNASGAVVGLLTLGANIAQLLF